MSIRGACQMFSISRTVYCYQPDAMRDDQVIKALQELAEARLVQGRALVWVSLCIAWVHKYRGETAQLSRVRER